MKPVTWGVLGTAHIAVAKVIPAMQRSPLCRVQAIASRDGARAANVARQLHIPDSYGSYDALLADPGIEAVYVPLPNHLHVPWAIRAAQAGKHVLCEKPIALNAAELSSLIDTRNRHSVHIEEAFMIRHHPQWQRARELVCAGAIGELRAIQIAFSFFNGNPDDYRHRPEMGGGGLYDIGCYAVACARFLFGTEPRRVLAALDPDPQTGVDRLASGILEFEHGQASFLCSMQLAAYQRVQVFGTAGRIEIEIPFNAPADRACRLFIDHEGALADASRATETQPPVDQYTAQAETFARVLRGERNAPYPLDDALMNMRTLDALFRSAASAAWQTP